MSMWYLKLGEPYWVKTKPAKIVVMAKQGKETETIFRKWSQCNICKFPNRNVVKLW